MAIGSRRTTRERYSGQMRKLRGPRAGRCHAPVQPGFQLLPPPDTLEPACAWICEVAGAAQDQVWRSSEPSSRRCVRNSLRASMGKRIQTTRPLRWATGQCNRRCPRRETAGRAHTIRFEPVHLGQASRSTMDQDAQRAPASAALRGEKPRRRRETRPVSETRAPSQRGPRLRQAS